MASLSITADDREEGTVPPPQKNIETSQRVGSAVAGANAGRNARSEINSSALLAGTDCIAIRHGECIYWLRATRQGKLLLTK